LKEKRDRALLALLLACGVRRHEAVELNFGHIQRREEHWAIVDLKGKAGHIRTIPMPIWVKELLDQWVEAANLTSGKLFRRVHKMGKAWGERLTEKAIWHAYAGSQIRSKETTISSLVGQAAHGSQPQIDCAWSEMASFEMNPITENNSPAESQPWFRTVPFPKFINRVSIATLSVSRGQAVQNGGLCLVQVGVEELL